MWKNESDSVKEEYHRLAIEEKTLHKTIWPDYRYMPKGSKSSFSDDNNAERNCEKEMPDRVTRSKTVQSAEKLSRLISSTTDNEVTTNDTQFNNDISNNKEPLSILPNRYFNISNKENIKVQQLPPPENVNHNHSIDQNLRPENQIIETDGILNLISNGFDDTFKTRDVSSFDLFYPDISYQDTSYRNISYTPPFCYLWDETDSLYTSNMCPDQLNHSKFNTQYGQTVPFYSHLI